MLKWKKDENKRKRGRDWPIFYTPGESLLTSDQKQIEKRAGTPMWGYVSRIVIKSWHQTNIFYHLLIWLFEETNNK